MNSNSSFPVNNNTGLLAVVNSPIQYPSVRRVRFFAVPDPVSVQTEVVFPLRNAYTSLREVPTHDEFYPIKPFERYLSSDDHYDHFKKQAASDGFDIVEITHSRLDDPINAVYEYQKQLGISGAHASNEELEERIQEVNNPYKSLSSFVTDEFYAAIDAFQPDILQKDPLRNWQVKLLSSYLIHPSLPACVVDAGLYELGIIDTASLSSIITQERQSVGINKEIGLHVTTKALHQELNKQVYTEDNF